MKCQLETRKRNKKMNVTISVAADFDIDVPKDIIAKGEDAIFEYIKSESPNELVMLTDTRELLRTSEIEW